MKKLKTVCFYDEVYNRNYTFIVGDRKEAEKYIKKKIGVETKISELCDGKAMEITNYGCVVWLNNFKKNPVSLGQLVHEINHITMFVFYGQGIRFDAEYSEPFTYYTEYLTRKFLELYK